MVILYRRILVPLDGFQLAGDMLPYAKASAKGLRALIKLPRVIEPPSNEMADSLHGVDSRRSADGVSSNVRDNLEGIALPLREQGFSAFTKVREGRPPDCVVAEAELESDTLLAISIHGRFGRTRWILCSVTDRVLRTTSTPVLDAHAASNEGASAEPFSTISETIRPPKERTQRPYISGRKRRKMRMCTDPYPYPGSFI